MKFFHISSRPAAAEANPYYIGIRRNSAAGQPHIQGIQNSLAAQWLRARRERARVATAGIPAPAFRAARRWSPGVVPPLVGGLLLAAAIFIATHHATGQEAFIAPDTLLKLAIVYLLYGAMYGAFLYLAASDVIWLCVLILGAAAYAVVTAGVLWGVGAAGIVALLLGGLGAWYVYGNSQIVPDGRVLVTGLAGGYARTLYPGRAVFVPFERTLAALETGERQFTSPTQSAEVPNELGEVYVARASASVAYSLIPAEAHHALAMGSQWERELHALIPLALRQALGEWGAHILMGDEAPPDKLLGKTLLRELREQVRPYGIHVIWVSVRNIWLVAEEEMPAIDAPAAAAAHDVPAAGRSGGMPAPPATLRYNAQPAQQATAATGGAVVAAATPPPPESSEAISPEVLSDAYEAVREGRINDPATIRHIARAFLQVADDATLSSTFPYDAAAAARILLDRAQALEGRH